jgi:hypothetical protein
LEGFLVRHALAVVFLNLVVLAGITAINTHFFGQLFFFLPFMEKIQPLFPERSKTHNPFLVVFSDSFSDKNFFLVKESKESFLPATLSFEVVRPTVLQLSFFSRMLPLCPEKKRFFVGVRNVGRVPAERLLLQVPSSLSLSCITCAAVKQLLPLEERRIELEGCFFSVGSATATLSAVNASPVPLAFFSFP